MRFALVGDVHLGPARLGWSRGVQRKLVGEAEPLLAAFVAEMNERERPDFVVNLGDAIEDVDDPLADEALLRRAAELLAGLRMPLYSLLGNHDVRSLGAERAAAILGHDRAHYGFDAGGFRFLALGFELVGESDVRAVVPAEQLRWLREELAATAAPVVVLSHYGLADDSMAGNFWFADEPWYAAVDNRAEVRAALEEAGDVRAVLSAHQHWNRLLVHGGIPYVTVTSLVENTRNDGVAAGAWALVELDRDGIEVDVRGEDPARFVHRFP